jgi:riboflavin kinase/FMN adenylyltransferase
MVMRIVHGGSAGLSEALEQVHPASRSCVAVGVFDGVHRGHRQIIAGMVEAAHAARYLAVALTFDPHPAITLGYEPPPLLLTTVDERAELLAALGLDVLVMLPFVPAIARTTAADFIGALVRHLRLAELWGGPDFAIGHRRAGNAVFLRRLGTRHGFTVRVVEPLVWEGAPVSSSRVRRALLAGDIHQATGCLGRPYRLAGTVVRGRSVGRGIGVPTANISPPPERLVPGGGVYACLAHTAHRGMRPAVTNIGVRPTFDTSSGGATAGGPAVVVEAHLLDFDADLYGQVLALDFIARLRAERAFPSTDALVAQIHADVSDARAILAGHAS